MTKYERFQNILKKNLEANKPSDAEQAADEFMVYLENAMARAAKCGELTCQVRFYNPTNQFMKNP